MLVALAPLAPAARGDTYPRQPGVDAVHYVFRLSFSDDTDVIEGEAVVRVRFVEDGVRELALDLVSAASGKGMTVASVAAGGGAVRHTHEANRLRLPLAPPPKAGEERSFTVRYRGVPADGLRFVTNMYGQRTVFSENWPDNARHWLPTIDHPYDKATGELIVTAPARYQVVANGLLVGERDLAGDRRRTHWRQSVPIASWLYAVGIARFAVHHAGSVHGVPLQTWVFPEDVERGTALFEETSRRAIDFFARRIGPYPYEKLANVQASGFSGATEHATAIFYGEKGVAEGRGPVVHEIAHQWWGNAVTERDWDDVWLSEGFATYFTLLFTEHDEGRDAFALGVQRSRERIRVNEVQLPDSPVIHRNLADMARVLNRLVYDKGGWTLHMLRRLVGDEVFWRAIREYYRRFRDRNASTDEFRQVVEGVSGQELGWFFDQWLRRSGIPTVEGTWRYDPARKQVEVILSQSQAADPYRLDIEIGIQGPSAAASRVERVRMADRRATFRFASERPPESVVLDPGTWLLIAQGPFTKQPHDTKQP